MFHVQHAIYLLFDGGSTVFSRMTRIPFPPFVGLSLSGDDLRHYDIGFVGWFEKSNMFMTQGTIVRKDWTLRKAQRLLQKTGWTEELEQRYVADIVRDSSIRQRARPGAKHAKVSNRTSSSKATSQ